MRPLTSLLSCGEEKVFFDKTCLMPGVDWRKEIKAAILNSEKFVVFWSRNSSASKEVKFELEIVRAVRDRKVIVPFLLDDTPLKRWLRDYQWISGQAFAARCGSLPQGVSSEVGATLSASNGSLIRSAIGAVERSNLFSTLNSISFPTLSLPGASELIADAQELLDELKRIVKLAEK